MRNRAREQADSSYLLRSPVGTWGVYSTVPLLTRAVPPSLAVFLLKINCIDAQE